MDVKRFFKLEDFQTKLLFKNSSWVFGGNIIRAVIVFLKGVIVARGLGAELFGTFNIIAAFAGLIHQFFAFPISSTIIKYGADFLTKKQYDKLAAVIKSGLFISFILGVLSTLTIILLTLFVYDVFLEDPDLETFVAVYAIIAASTFIDGISSTVLRLFYKFKENSLVVVLSAVVELIVIGIVVYLYPKDLFVFFIAFFASKLISSLMLNTVAFIELNRVLKGYWSTPVNILEGDKKSLLQFTLANSGSRSIKTVINNGDVLLLGALLGPIPVAFYNIAKKLAQSILIVIDPLTHTLFPQLSLLISENKHGEIKVMITKITKLIVIPSILVIAILNAFIDQLISLTFGTEYMDAAQPFLFLSINAVLSAILFWNLPLILSMGMVTFRFIINVLALIAGGLVAYFTTPIWGAAGVALGLLIANGSAIITFSIATFSKLNKKPVE